MREITVERNVQIEPYQFVKVTVTCSKEELGKEKFTDEQLANNAVLVLIKAIKKVREVSL